MIQDIEPARFDNAYKIRAPRADDRVICYRAGELLIRENGGEDGTHLPRYDEIAAFDDLAPEDFRYLFAVDGIGYMLCPSADIAEVDGLSFERQSALRKLPKPQAFAGACGMHLAEWYARNRFCGRCGTLLEASASERALICPSCGDTNYPHISPVVIVGILNHGQILLTRYAHSSYVHWSLVAGFVEVGETLEDAVRREVAEEVGLKVTNLCYHKSQPWGITGTVLMGFFAEVDGSATVTLNADGLDELGEARWFTRDEMEPIMDHLSLTHEMMESFWLGHTCADEG